MEPLTKEEIILALENNDIDFFTDLYYEETEGVKVVYDQRFFYAHGCNEWKISLLFEEYNIYINLDGYFYTDDGYSYAAQESEFKFIYQAEPFEYKETRYKRITKETIRDNKIKTLLDGKE